MIDNQIEECIEYIVINVDSKDESNCVCRGYQVPIFKDWGSLKMGLQNVLHVDVAIKSYAIPS